MFEPYSTPMIIGHRGACAHAPENTIASFQLAHQQGADAVELDVKLSADEVAVVIHDQRLDRTTNGTGKVNDTLLTEMKHLDAGSFFNEKFRNEPVPTLDEVFEAIGGRILINVELTNYASPRDNLIPIVAEIVKRHGLEAGVFFSSFLPRNLSKMKALLPQVPVAILCNTGITGRLTCSKLMTRISPEVIHPNFAYVTAELIDREHTRGRRIHAWTVNNEADLKRMVELKVDGIFTDDPLRALQLVGRK